MSGFANTVFTLMIGWFRTVVSLIWSGLTDKNGGNLFTWIGNHWIVIALILFAVGTVVDLSVYLFRWRPLDVIRSYFDRKREMSVPVILIRAAFIHPDQKSQQTRIQLKADTVLCSHPTRLPVFPKQNHFPVMIQMFMILSVRNLICKTICLPT